MGEHLPCKQGVRGSNPLISTRYLKEYRNTIKCCTMSKCNLVSIAHSVTTSSRIQPNKNLLWSKLQTVFYRLCTHSCNVNLENFIQRDIIIKPFIINKTSEKIFKYV